LEKEITIKQAQEQVDDWIKALGVRYFSELTNMAVLTEEVGELARVMSRAYGDQSFKEGELGSSTSSDSKETSSDTKETSSDSKETNLVGGASIPSKEMVREKLGDEMADVLWVLICLANQTGIDLTEAFQKNMEKKTLRDSKRHKNNIKL
jgi:NTP pyrophosphatase (non-canonical NTP hydrolase)